MRRRRKRGGDDWVDVTPGELYVYLGLRIIMGCHHRERARTFWSEGGGGECMHACMHFSR